ncbi:RidA family protein [Parvibaculum sedimenti]|uniref:RidA family protein n=1 Tax=Parvibaculum sedimenti TaxID=2608632 RepID=A0A6N6VMG8_9HYPH|nr:RidA family protein [Parvibaculum sedimenti]KAB7740212.1 RidA family protein [Parvibaculum sedimenti]
MTGRIDARLSELAIVLPKAAAPMANYVPWVITGNLVFISGQGPVGPNGVEYAGKLGRDHDVEAGRKAARLTALNVIAQLREAVGGNLDRVKRCVKLVGFVNSTPEFNQQPAVINGASDLMVEIFGDAGRHARSAVSTPSLPVDISVEVEAIFEIE